MLKMIKYHMIFVKLIRKDKLLRIIAILALLTNFALADEFESFEDEFTTPKEVFDPLNGYNRFMTQVNDKIYIYAVNPIATGYRDFVDQSVRSSIDNFFDNLLFPIRFVNNLLQGKIKNSGEELFRFVVNTTLGVGGFGDAGEDIFGIKAHHEDFGQTLGFYGVSSGFPIVLPFLGPSNLRDTIGLSGDYFLAPISYLNNQALSTSLKSFDKLNNLSFHVKEIETLKKGAVDLYPFLQNFYENYRDQAIKE